MSYAIIRNNKLTRAEAQGLYLHNNRRSKGHSNKEIDNTKTNLNFYYKENKTSYIKEFDRIKNDFNLKGHIRSNSIIMCEMVITSDNSFFDKIGIDEAKRYFEESYKFVCNYKNLGEQNIISAVVHLDEITPHMHLVYIPVIHTKDKEGNNIDKICARDFWKGKNSYRELQDAFHTYITSKGFNLERGLPVEETGATNLKIENLKKLTNFENVQNISKNITIDLPKVPDINDIKLIQLNKSKVENEIIKPKDNLINKLHQENIALNNEILKQIELVNKAEKYQRERENILTKNKELTDQVKHLERKYNNRIEELEEENRYLSKVIEKFKETLEKFIHWICKIFSLNDEETLINRFQTENSIYLDPEKQIQFEEDFEYEELNI